MTKDQKEFEAWALPILKKYQKILLLTDHALTFKYDKAKTDENEAAMTHDYAYPYKETRICYSDNSLEDFKKGERQELKKMLIHELCHSLTDPLYGAGFDRFITKNTLNNERERLTDHIANIITANL
jgi:hypothetical protein